MSDAIVGLSVLQPTWVPGIYRLWFTGQKSDGTKAQGNVFIAEEGSANIPAKFPDYPEGCNSIWWFKRVGAQLHCHPSVNWISWQFHNGYSWTTNWVEMTTAEKTYQPNGPDPIREDCGHAVHYDLNLACNQDRLPEMVAELKKQGKLK